MPGSGLGRLRALLVESGASEDYSGGSSAAVGVVAAGAGTAAEEASGGSSAPVAVVAVGAGDASEQASGGAAADVAVTAVGDGVQTEPEDYSGGASASVVVGAVGEGEQGTGSHGGVTRRRRWREYKGPNEGVEQTETPVVEVETALSPFRAEIAGVVAALQQAEERARADQKAARQALDAARTEAEIQRAALLFQQALEREAKAKQDAIDFDIAMVAMVLAEL